ncbi:hypothetical protein D6C83_09045 [Aureobasidium pullulans]|uniref:Uncharacterized protein n=1 Tax=Aureobasidium pullulans TaxID=5580 RepID=A0A4S9Z4F6_AURPU|nr:hypothetical protein D6C83_09045 [Aureobasidium pullulans]
MSFKKTFERHLNKELEDNQDNALYPPQLSPKDLESQSPPPPPPQLPPQVFPSYPERRGGMNIPTPIFILLILVLLVESCIIFVYTVVALWNTLPMPMPMPMHLEQPQPLIISPQWQIPAAASAQTITETVSTTIFSTITASTTLSASTTTLSASTATTTLSASTTTLSASPTTIPPVTITKPAPTITVLSTVSAPQLPSITTETILSTIFLTINKCFNFFSLITLLNNHVLPSKPNALPSLMFLLLVINEYLIPLYL